MAHPPGVHERSYWSNEGRSIARARVPADRVSRTGQPSTTGGIWVPDTPVRSTPMSEVDVAVVGGGPAGMTAALAAARAGASVVLIDEYAAPGGQIWRRRFDEVGEDAPESLPRPARELCAELAASSVQVLAGHSVWAAPEPGVLLLTGELARIDARRDRARHRRLRPPGRLPGMDLARRDDRGRRAGAGEGSGRRPRPAGAARRAPARSCSRSPRSSRRAGPRSSPSSRPPNAVDWVRASKRMAAYPGRLVDYARYRTTVRKVLWGQVIVRAEGDGRVESATIARAAADWSSAGAERTFQVDAVCTAYGFLPSVDLARALGCALDGDAVAHDEDMRTTVPNVFVAGEATGIGGADLAQVEGELAGFMAAAHAHALAPTATGTEPSPSSPTSRRCAARGRRARASPGSSPTSSTPRPGSSASRRRTRSSAAARTSPRARSTPRWPAARPRCRR